MEKMEIKRTEAKQTNEKTPSQFIGAKFGYVTSKILVTTADRKHFIILVYCTWMACYIHFSLV